ncbi:hypothetical protein RAS1_22300 [Phycisphaerae bacterium RAS1]|nr:hypothetical protein RAS1_22300 [Phycisphaerae bacterium RAS1]
MADRRIELDVLVFGGGAAALWTLDELVRAGHAAAAIESKRLGEPQTVCAQGIIHGGLKYTLDGGLSESAEAIREMPGVWRACLAGRRQPDLRRTRVRSESCLLWRTRTWKSWAGMVGAKVGLRVAPVPLEREDWPAILHGCPGEVYRLDEQVIDPVSLLSDFATTHATRLVAAAARPPEFTNETGRVTVQIQLSDGRPASFQASTVIFAAGEGNAALRVSAGLGSDAMQRRPLHMAMVRGDLPPLNGHCVDGGATRVTITSDTDSGGRTVWQLGGQISEAGVSESRDELIHRSRRELEEVIPGIALDHAEWATYRVDRAEAAAGGKRPADVSILRDGPFLTAWPTKMALAPHLAEKIVRLLPPPRVATNMPTIPSEWPRPGVAAPPWEWELPWSVVR